MQSSVPLAPPALALVAALVLAALDRARPGAVRGVSVIANAAGLGLALAALRLVHAGPVLVFALPLAADHGPALLVLDRLAAWILVASRAAVLLACVGDGGACTLGPRFHARLQLGLLGLDATCLAAGLVPLYLAWQASVAGYAALVVQQAGARHSAAARQLCVALIAATAVAVAALVALQATLGTLDLAALARSAPGNDAWLLGAGGIALVGVFALQSVALPYALVVPAAFAAAPAAVTCLAAPLAAAGLYAVLRLNTLVFPCFMAGPCGPSAGLLPLGLATLVTGSVAAVLASRPRVLVAAVTVALLGAVVVATGSLRTAGLAAGVYLAMHTVIVGTAGGLLSEAVAGPDARRWGALSRAGACLTLAALAGLPPLSGFIGTLALLRAAGGDALPVWCVLLGSLLVVQYAIGRVAFGARGPYGERSVVPSSRAVLLAGGMLAAFAAGSGPGYGFASATARQLFDRAAYVDAAAAGGQASAHKAVSAASGESGSTGNTPDS